MKVYNNNQLYKSPAGDQLWNSGRQNWIFGRIGDQKGAISDPADYGFFACDLWKDCIMPSSQKQITEIKVEGMIAGYSSSCCINSKKHKTNTTAI